MTEYRAGQIWLDTTGEVVIRAVTSPTSHTEFWLDGGNVYTNQNNSLIERYKSTLLYNPPVEWKVGDTVPADTILDRAWTAWSFVWGAYQTLDPKHNQAFTFDAKIIWIETKENTNEA